MALSTAAPAMAASAAVICPPTPAGGGINPSTVGGWTWTKSNNTNSAPCGMISGSSTTFNMWTDSTSSVGTNTATVTATSSSIAVKAGCTYQLTVTVQTQGGYYGGTGTPNYGCTTTNTNMVVTMGTQQMLTLSTQSVGGYQVVQFPIEAPNANGGCASPYGFGANGIANATQTFIPTYTANSTGNVTVTMLFTMWGNNNAGNNDDIHATILVGPACLC